MRRAVLPSRGVLPIVVCLNVIDKPHRGDLGPLGLLIHEKEIPLSKERSKIGLCPL